MQLSARNQFPGHITALHVDGLMAEVAIDIGSGNLLTALITRASAESLKLAVGDDVRAVIKSTEILVGK
jgi:molybdate transport system regulatory protein